jgi:mannonate dehydratase
MKLGTQFPPRDDDDLRIMAQCGVTHVSLDPPGSGHDWSVDDIARHRDRLAEFDLTLDMVQLPLSSRPIAESLSPDIMRAGPDRDAQIESICRLIARLGQVGIPAAKYNLNLIGIPRSADEPGRGGASCSAFRWEAMDQDAAPGPAGVVEAEENWARIEYFLAAAIPAADAAGVRLACHPHDPWTPPGYMGITRVLGDVDGLKRFVGLSDSPNHGLNFCIGTVGEMLTDPGAEIEGVTRWFAERGRIHNVHYRNIIGVRASFREAFPDEGDMDLGALLRVLHGAGYAHMIMPDHMPTVAGRDPKGTAFAFAYGYIAAQLETLRRGPRPETG